MLVAPLVAAVTAGCATTRTPYSPPLDTGHRVTINRSFEFLPNYSRIYFQYGEQVAKSSLDRWDPYCRLHVFNRDRKADYLTRVTPGDFAISSVKLRYQSSDYPYYGSGPGIFSSVSFGLTSFDSSSDLARRDGPPNFYLYRIVMKLNSTFQPDVKTLTCSRKWSTRGNYFPTLAEIRAALGEQIEITRSGG